MDYAAIINALELALVHKSFNRIRKLKKQLQAEVERLRMRREAVPSFEVEQRPAPPPQQVDPVPANDLVVGLTPSRGGQERDLYLPRTVWRAILRLSDKGGWLPNGEDVTPYDCKAFAAALKQGIANWLPSEQAENDRAGLLKLAKYREMLDKVIALALQGLGIRCRLRALRAI